MNAHERKSVGWAGTGVDWARGAGIWVVVAALAAFGGSLFSGFHFDDFGMLQDPAIALSSGWARCWGLLQTRPLTWFSFWLNYQVSGREPLLWHLVNIVLHAGCSLLLYRNLLRVAQPIAFFGALIFAVHPIQAESVDYVYARAIVLCTLFSLMALDDWICGREWRSVGWFALAMLSKEECASVPLALALYSTCEGKLRGRVMPIAAMLGMSVMAGVRVIYAIHVTGMKNIGVHAGISPLGYLSEQGIALLRYFGLMVFPWAFTVDPELPSPGWGWRLLAWLVVLVVIGAAWAGLRTVKAAFWILAGFLLLIPSSSIFPAADLAADRRMYLPLAAFAPAIAWLLRPWRWRWTMMVPAVLALLAMERTYVWSSDARLWSEAVARGPDKVRPRIQLSRAVDPQQAITILHDAERLASQDPDVPAELARVYLELHRPAEALGQAGRALALAPGEPHALNNRGAVLLGMGQTEAARRDFLAALRRNACLGEARENLARSGGVPEDAPRCR